ncbi:hypothetical protein [Paracoccus laeviglucosivorans]|uniref:Yip1 domain-containing protein n=1 Tax=Paracoccus laeviglucosivorans TaxID=1197861 RepID=A0A521C0Q7_9RHOB|nr:hypothetical protein [Paracoccus laeviglucosivorans]SMO52945.1 hypothetical protein SAMN06265221_103303 [Paracoccus laeviglucosivorans]
MQSGIVPRIVQSWWAPGRVVTSLRGIPDRALVVILMAAMLMFLVAQTPEHARAAHLDPSVPMAARMAGAATAVLFMMPLVAYALAALVAGLSRLTPWRIDPQASRLALFWALLAVAPAMLLAGLTAGLVGPGPALTLTRAVAGLGFLMIWGAGLRAVSTASAQ